MNKQDEVRWVLVAGLSESELPDEVHLASEAVGRALARKGYGLVVGGFDGVDRVVPSTFAEELRAMNRPLADYLIQVVVEDKEPEFKGGNIVYVEEGKQWKEVVIQAEVVVLLGGRGSFITYLFGLHQERPVFPLAGTEGNAREAYEDILERWKRHPIKGIAPEVFREKLRGSISSPEDAELMANNLIELIEQNFKARSIYSSAESKSIFISYSHVNEKWLDKLQEHLRPMSRDMGVNIWSDKEIKAGERWEEAIQNALDSATIVIFVVTQQFIDSRYIHEHELLQMLWAAKERGVIITWIHLEHSYYQRTGLQHFQALHEIKQPLRSLSSSARQKVLVDITKRIEALL